MKISRACMAAVVLTILSGAAWAHGGEDHGDEVALAPPAAVAPRTSAETEEFELVAVLQGKQLILTLDRFATNEPVADAKIDVESGNALKAVAKQVAAGSYVVQVPDGVFAKPGKYPLTMTVQAGDSSDLLTASLDLAPAASVGAPVKSGDVWITWRNSLAVLLLVGMAILAVVVIRRKKNNRTSK